MDCAALFLLVLMSTKLYMCATASHAPHRTWVKACMLLNRQAAYESACVAHISIWTCRSVNSHSFMNVCRRHKGLCASRLIAAADAAAGRSRQSALSIT